MPIFYREFETYMAMNIAKMLFPLLTLPYLTRVLSTDCYGSVVYVKSVTTYLQLLVDFGFVLSATKSIVQAREDRARQERIMGDVLLVIFLMDDPHQDRRGYPADAGPQRSGQHPLCRREKDGEIRLLPGLWRQGAQALSREEAGGKGEVNKTVLTLLGTVRESYDYVLIDLPPLGSVIDAAVVARQVRRSDSGDLRPSGALPPGGGGRGPAEKMRQPDPGCRAQQHPRKQQRLL